MTPALSESARKAAMQRNSYTVRVMRDSNVCSMLRRLKLLPSSGTLPSFGPSAALDLLADQTLGSAAYRA